MKHLVRGWWGALLEMAPLWIVLFLLVSTWCMLPRRLFFVPGVEAGTIASRDYVADRDLSVINAAATREMQDTAREDVLPVYDFHSLETIRRRQLVELFAEGRSMLEGAGEDSAAEDDGEDAAEDDLPADLLARLTEASNLKLTADEAELLYEREFSAELAERLSGILTRILRTRVVTDKALLLEHGSRGITVNDLASNVRTTQLDFSRYHDYPDQVRDAIEEDLHGWEGLTSRERQLLADLIFDNVIPNLTLNSSETLALREEAVEAVGTLSYTKKKGEVIVRKGEEVDALAVSIIAEMASTRDLVRLLLAGFGTLILLAAAILLIWLVTGQEVRSDCSRPRLLNECLILLIVHIAGARFAVFVAGAISDKITREPFSAAASYTYAIPFAALALVSVLLYGRNTALVLSVVFSLLVGHIAGGEAIWMMTFYALASSVAAVFALDQAHFKQRMVMNRAGAIVGLVNVAGVLALKALAGDTAGGIAQLGFDLICGFAGGLLASAVTSFAVPILETLLSITTYIKLLELANPNLPLLRRLALEAPGTFQHSLAVANLAKAGCEAIERDSVWTNTGALYHDIGKIFRPQYFIENQMGQNPHDKIQPSMSALIIINHVKEGLELAHENHLPQPIFDAIEQHHGSRLIKFFYNKAKERCDPETEEVREEEFRYPGPKPQNKEMGILMLADAVEAASRTLVEPNRQKIRTLLRRIFDDCLRDRQLDHTDLTLGDLRKVEEAFQRALTNIYHRRVDYPGFDFNQAVPGPRDSERTHPSPKKKRSGDTEEVPVREPIPSERRKAS